MIEPSGFMGNGLQAASYYRPPQKKFEDALCRAAIRGISYHDAAPVAVKYQNRVSVLIVLTFPSGICLHTLGERLALTMVDDWAAQYRRVYGYLGGVKLLPACLTKILFGLFFFG